MFILYATRTPYQSYRDLPCLYIQFKNTLDSAAAKVVTLLPDAAQLRFFVAGLVAPYMKLRGGVEFVDEIPRSMSGKILRRTLRAMAGATRSRL